MTKQRKHKKRSTIKKKARRMKEHAEENKKDVGKCQTPK
ncbi:prophage P2a protein 25 [Lactiplantibacillus plantarum]|nr:prophage P2a protein 25 [Lactiplantibacillus plantarum]